MDKLDYTNFNHPFCDYNCILRLVKEVEKYGKLVIGFDFDNTIFDVHNNGGNYKHIIDTLKSVRIEDGLYVFIPLNQMKNG